MWHLDNIDSYHLSCYCSCNGFVSLFQDSKISPKEGRLPDAKQGFSILNLIFSVTVVNKSFFMN